MHTKTIEVEGVRFNLSRGYMATPDGTGISNDAFVLVCSHIPERCSFVARGFSQENLATRGLVHSSNTNVSVSGLVCDAVRFRQTQGSLVLSKWAIFYPVGMETKLFIVTFSADFDELEQIKQVRSTFADLEIVKSQKRKSHFSCFSFQSVSPFAVANSSKNQVTLSVGGEFPLKTPTDPVISFFEMRMRLLPLQFEPYISKRLQSIDADPDTIEITNLSDVVFAVKGTVNLGGIEQRIHARYYFLPKFVINAEAFMTKDDLNNHLGSVQEIFRAIRPHE